jgi:hypothetical protein
VVLNYFIIHLFREEGKVFIMNEQLNDVGFKKLYPFRNIYPASPSYLTEAELDREWERRHRQGQFGKAPGTRAEEEVGS